MNKRDVVSARDVETYYSECRKIKFIKDNRGNVIEVKSLNDIITYLIIKRVPTYYMRGGYHCDRNRIRSVDDYIKISKSYFPKKTVSEILQELVVYENSSPANNKFNLNYCPNIKKYNFQSGFNSWNRGIATTTTTFKDQGFPNCKVPLVHFF